MGTENAMEEEVLDDPEITEEIQAEEEEETTEESQAEPEPENDIPYGVKKRLAEMAAQKGQFEREKEAALKKAHELAQEKVRLAEEVEQLKAASLKTVGRPKLEDFETDEDFFVALNEWQFEQRETKAKERREKEVEVKTREQAEEDYRSKVINTNKNGAKKYKDYEEVVFSLPGDVMNLDMASAIFETDAPEDIAYHLGKNPTEAAKIAKLSPLKKAIALGKIEQRLTNKKTTNAPPPITPVKGSSSSTFDPDKLLAENPREWIKLRNEGKI